MFMALTGGQPAACGVHSPYGPDRGLARAGPRPCMDWTEALCGLDRGLLDGARLEVRVPEDGLEMPLGDRQHLVHRDLAPELVREGGHAGVADAAGDDLVEVRRVRIHVQREAVHRDALGDADAHGAD